MHEFGIRAEVAVFLGSVGIVVALYLFYLLWAPRPRAIEAPPAPAAVTVQARAMELNYGWLDPVARPLLSLLRWTNAHLTRRWGRSSWGWAIIVVTFLINLVLLPFKLASARATRKIQALQPQVDAIRAKYQKNKGSNEGMMREISALYKAHGARPMGGCIWSVLPWFLLMAFYSVLTTAPDLKGAPWLWVTDLSRPEQSPVHLLPLFMVLTQVVLQKLTPEMTPDPRMRRMMLLMPVVFGFVFYSQPAGLMLYWVTGNLLAIAQQWATRPQRT